MKQLTNTELVAHLLGPRVIEGEEEGTYYRTSPHPYFAEAYTKIMADAQMKQHAKQHTEIILESVDEIDGLVQSGLKPTDRRLSCGRGGKIFCVLNATYPLVELIGTVDGVDQLVLTYMGLMGLEPPLVTREDLEMLYGDFSPERM